MNGQSNINNLSNEDYGFIGLYGGLTLDDIYERKGIQPKQNIFMFMGITERAAIYFLATQAEAKVKRDNPTSDEIKKVHLQVGEKIRQTIKAIGNPMPEDLPIQAEG